MTPVSRHDQFPRVVGGGLRPAARAAAAFDRGVTTLSELSLWAGVACLVLLLAIVLLQVFAGLSAAALPQLSRTMSASWEHAGFLMGAAFVLAMPATLRAGGHIRVTLLRDHLSEASARIADMVASLVVTGMLGFLALAMTTRALASFDRGSVSTASLTPLWLPEAAFAFAFALFALQALARLLSLLAGLEAEAPRDLVGEAME
ncbi:TRAP transporter small permease subunit [Salipiger sp.]|uniref:TRAP transporter small permease subunit n=1 Tax=Salipiger sp. TaxID=2078585 RepID=UPI003A97E2B2